jgi:solute carrier family 38 (sodium-coupled neutral amino acid transporter), member 11
MTTNGRPKSPFFQPTEKPDFTSTPGGTKHRVEKDPSEIENKSTILGCSSNLITAIVGSGIVGLPFAIKQAGFVAGIFLVCLCAVLTDKSLRLLIETAKHVHVATYEMTAEAAFGRVGFVFVAGAMFINAYGACLSYLMIVKDTFSSVFGVNPHDLPMRRAILFLVSITIMVPLSSQRDMADLDKTSKINVLFDTAMVLIVLFSAPIAESWQTFDWRDSIIHMDTIFVGVGVLSFAFVCQHASFVIAGSLEQPTKERWATVTRSALTVSATLSLLLGTCGFVAYGEETEGNILNNLDESFHAKFARGLLGSTMLFVYPIELMVCRHILVVTVFQGRSAHEGDDTNILNRRDRRITLTVFLYLIGVIPAAMCENLGYVLATSGAVGASCLAYIYPGLIYMGVHGGRFLELSAAFFGPSFFPEDAPKSIEMEPLYVHDPSNTPDLEAASNDSFLVSRIKFVLWYLWLMPLWVKIAAFGKKFLTKHVHDLAMQTPHSIRIGNVRFAQAKLNTGETRVVMISRNNSKETVNKTEKFATETTLLHSDSMPDSHHSLRSSDGRIVALPNTSSKISKEGLEQGALPTSNPQKDYKSINQTIAENLVKGVTSLLSSRKKEEEEYALEDDPQEIPPGPLDFFIAIFFATFGVVAMVAGLFSIFHKSS